MNKANGFSVLSALLMIAAIAGKPALAEPITDPAIDAGNALGAALEAILERVKNPNTAGVGRLTPQEVQRDYRQLQTALLDWKRSIESDLDAAMKSKAGNTLKDMDRKVLLITGYFAYLTDLIQIHAYAQQPPLSVDLWSEPESDPAFQLEVSSGLLGELSGFDAIPGFENSQAVSAALHSPQAFIVPEFIGGGKARLSMGSNLSAGIRSQSRSNNHTEGAFLEMTRLLFTQTLVSNWIETNSVRLNPALEGPRIPVGLRKEIGSLLPDPNAIQDAHDDQAIRSNAGPLLAAATPVLGTEAFKDRLLNEAKTIFADGEKRALYTDAQMESLFKRVQDAERAFTPVLLTRAIEAFPFSWTAFDKKDRASLHAALRRAIAQARVDAVLKAFAAELGPSDDLHGFGVFLNRRAMAYMDGLTDAVLAEKVSRTFEAAREKGFAPLREKYVSEAVAQAERAHAAFNGGCVDSMTADSIDLSALVLSLRPDFKKLAMKSTGMEWVKFIAKAPSHNGAVGAYLKIVDKLASQAKAEGGTPKGEGIRKDLEAVRAFGIWAGLEYSAPRLNPEQKQAYCKVIQGRSLDLPILSMGLEIESGRPLYESLVRWKGNPAYQGILIELALGKTQEAIHRDLETIAELRTFSDFSKLSGRSALMKRLVEKGFPQFKDFQEKMIDQIAYDAANGESWKEFSSIYSNPMNLLMTFFIGKMGASLLRPTHAINRLIVATEATIMPRLEGYLLAGMGTLFGEMAVTAMDYSDAKADRRRTESFFYGSSTAQNLYDYFNVLEAKDKEQAFLSSLKVQAGTQALFFGSHLFAREVAGIRARLNEWKYEYYFDKIGMEKGKARWDAKAINEAADLRAKALTDGKNPFGGAWEVEKARASLLNEIKRREALIDQVKRDLKSSFETLGLKTTFSLEEIDQAYLLQRKAWSEDRISTERFKEVEIARQHIHNFIYRESIALQPTGMTKLAYKARDALRWAFGLKGLEGPSLSQISSSLLYELYGIGRMTARKPGEIPKVEGSLRDAYLADLGLDRDSDNPRAIKLAHRELLKKHHPNFVMGRHGTEAEIKEATETSIRIQAAYDMLMGGVK